MSVFTNKDILGVKRGKCLVESCDCDLYQTKSDGPTTCLLCGCFPAKHAKIVPSESEPGVESLKRIETVEGKEGKITPPKVGDHAHTTKAPEKKKIDDLMAELTPSKVVSFAVHDDGNLELEGIFPMSSVDNASESLFLDNSKANSENSFSPEQETGERQSTSSPEEGMPRSDSDKSKSAPKTNRQSIARAGTVAKARFAIIQKPSFSYDLCIANKKDTLLKHEFEVYAELASYLLSLTNGEKPTQEEFNIFCSQIVDFYPVLKSFHGDVPWSVLKTALLRHLINRRYNERRGGKQIKPCALVQSPMEVESEENMEEDSLEKALTDLKLVSENTPKEEVCRLLKITLTHRRSMTEDVVIFPHEVVMTWPHLLNSTGMKYDFYNWLNISEETLSSNLLEFVKTLAKMQETTVNSIDDPTDLSALTCLATLAKSLEGKRKKDSPSIITVLEVRQSLDTLKPTEKESPRLVLNLNSEEHIQGFLMFDAHKMDIISASALNCVSALIGAYYLFDVNYIAPYFNFLFILDKEVLKKPQVLKSKYIALNKFYRDYNKNK